MAAGAPGPGLGLKSRTDPVNECGKRGEGRRRRRVSAEMAGVE